MISKATTVHFCFMMSLTVLHLIIGLTSLMDLLANLHIPGETFRCSYSHFFNHLLYFSVNAILLLFFFDCARNAKIHSTDVLIFSNKKRFTKYGIPVVVLQFLGYFLADFTCQTIKFPGFRTTLYCLHLIIEVALVYYYFGWYQRQLVSLTDSQELDEMDVNKTEPTYN